MSASTEIHIRASGKWQLLNWQEIQDYRDLLFLLVRRDFVARYKQTLLGPAWAIIQPVATALVFTVVFGKIAQIPTDGAPPFLFYMTGMLFWSLFSGSVQSGGNSLQANASLFNKVYFPRIIPSLATQISQLIPFSIQFIIFSGFCAWYYLTGEETHFHWLRLLWVPVLLIHTLIIALGASLLYSALTAKYRDLNHALGFLVQLGLYLTPVIYPVSSISEAWRWLVWINPMAAPVSAAKWVFLDAGYYPGFPLLFSGVIGVTLLILALICFQNVQRTFVDTV